ncbi:hypothetical protein SUGI_0856060 [Cryptomeria japonica]|uniref:pentatricopeptide repeat-containing protein At2g15630, mitochondrial n=1 Tax=Cryptomeria japonica TaxID=3369 RepID=UPI002414B920|nr:pentatricopeptide repeat-containing protein At2g15630, mitochondrial [Cryptomeria japonica]GLJ41363.1 hypothetical protein SUGI_0856060 [Cryptomeria japonica]
MAALSVSASLLKCSVAHKNNNIRSMPIKVGQAKKPSLQLQRRSFKVHAVVKERESDKEYQIGRSLSEGIDKELLSKFRADEFAEKASSEYNSAIEILSLAGFTDEAIELKQCMEMKRIPLTTDTYVPLIIGLCLKKKTKEAMALLVETKGKPGCEPNEFAYGAIIERMYQDKMNDGALLLVRDMISRGLVPLEVTVAGLINAMCKHKYFSMATELVHQILQPNIVYYNCLIEALGKYEEAGLAKNTLTLMEKRGVDADYESYYSVITSCASKGLVDDATRVVLEMTAKGFGEVPEIEPEEIEELEAEIKKKGFESDRIEELKKEMKKKGMKF